jgi:CheY-like chemotaxis protein/HPt (histidine-containing phosphotransfer) domain-containing protein/two-component sensor histidine kinase
VHTIQSNGDMLLSLVDNVLDFSKLEAGTLILDNRDFDVVELVESVLEIMGFSAFSRGLELFSTLRHDMHLRVSADKRRLRQVLVNLVGNAVKYTETGYVSVETRTSRDAHGQVRLEFVVTDTGPGINEEIRKVIFEPFVTSASLDGQHHDGSGLGLTICKRLIEAMQGRIAIENIEGGGTRARFCVPVEVRDSVLGGDVKASARIPERVLIAHETDAAAQSIAAHLSAWGIISESTNRASDAVHRLRSAAAAGRGFDLAIIDSGLTREDPLLCVRRIREAGELENLPIVLLVPITSQLEYGEVSGLGGIRCLMKPILPIQLRYNVLKSMAVHVEQLGESRRTHRHVADDITVLIADDNVVNAQLLSGMLTAEGFDTDTVNDGESVVRALETRDYDLLLLDGQMPDMDGHVVAKEIRSRPEKYAHQPIIVAVTADTSDAYRELCFDVGMDGFMVKPVRMQKLRDGLSEWCTLIAEKRAASRIDDSIVCRALRMNIIERTGERDESFLDSYIGLFLKDTHERIDALVAAIDRRDTERLRRECHALKGACLEFGAERMIRYCEEITSAASSLDFSEASEALQRLDREFARLKPVYESASRDQLH